MIQEEPGGQHSMRGEKRKENPTVDTWRAPITPSVCSGLWTVGLIQVLMMCNLSQENS